VLVLFVLTGSAAGYWSARCARVAMVVEVALEVLSLPRVACMFARCCEAVSCRGRPLAELPARAAVS
jgi:hypothetical protein